MRQGPSRQRCVIKVASDDAVSAMTMRFIAGAVCEHCGAVDRIRVEVAAGARRRECVACGHSDVLEEASDPLPQGRLDAPIASLLPSLNEPEPKTDPDVMPVRIIGGTRKRDT